MKIDIDRAIQILDPEHREHYESLEEVNEACRMGMEALKALRWTTVEERLPEARKTVLVSINSVNPEIQAENGPCVFIAWLNENGVWEDILDEIPANVWKVTHWMPIPEPPKMVYRAEKAGSDESKKQEDNR